jgi:phage gp46-like protein
MTSDLLTNPQYWRDRAKEIQGIAERSTHPETKRTLQNIAADYEHLAQRAEERLQESRRVKRWRVLADDIEVGTISAFVDTAP